MGLPRFELGTLTILQSKASKSKAFALRQGNVMPD